MMDKRPEAEIQVGAVLNAIEPLEANIDQFLIVIIDAPRVLWGTKREIMLARHYAFAARCRITQLYEKIERSVYWLKDTRNLTDGIVAMENASSDARSLLESVMTANAVFGQGVRPNGETWENQGIWERIVRQAGELPQKIADAKTALTAAGLTAEGRL